jgi:hypothetical protein
LRGGAHGRVLARSVVAGIRVDDLTYVDVQTKAWNAGLPLVGTPGIVRKLAWVGNYVRKYGFRS